MLKAVRRISIRAMTNRSLYKGPQITYLIAFFMTNARLSGCIYDGSAVDGSSEDECTKNRVVTKRSFNPLWSFQVIYKLKDHIFYNLQLYLKVNLDMQISLSTSPPII